MIRRLLLLVVVTAVFHAVTATKLNDTVIEKIKEERTKMESCFCDLFKLDSKSKQCKTTKDFEANLKLYKNAMPKSELKHINKEYSTFMINAVNDKKFPDVIKDEKCMDMDALKVCSDNISKTPMNITLRIKLFKTVHDIQRTESSCITAKKVQSCILEDVFKSCQDETVEFYKKLIELDRAECAKVKKTDDAGNHNVTEKSIKGNNGAARQSNIFFGSVVLVLITIVAT